MKIPRLLSLYPVALADILWTFTFGLFSQSSRYRIFQLAQETPSLRPRIPSIHVMDLIDSREEFTLLASKAAPGNVSLLELNALAWLAENRRAKTLFEFGTFDGRTALNLVAHSAPGAHLYTLDLPSTGLDSTKLAILPHERDFVDKPSSGLRFQGSHYGSQITQLLGDSATFDLSPYWGRMDLVFIDASHAYDYVKSDTENAFKLLNPAGGLLIWHDYAAADWPDVQRALDEFYGADARFKDLKRIQDTTLAVLEVRPRV